MFTNCLQTVKSEKHTEAIKKTLLIGVVKMLGLDWLWFLALHQDSYSDVFMVSDYEMI